MRPPAILALTLSLAIPGLAAASGSSGMTSPQPQMRTATPEEEAIEYYNDGISCRDKADKYEAEAAAGNDAAKKAKLLEKSKSQHESSIKKYLKAVAENSQMVQAWGSPDPAGIDPSKLDEFGKWASERKQLAAQTSSLTSGQELRW